MFRSLLCCRANEDIAQVRSRADSESVALHASLRKEQMKVDSLERALHQKVLDLTWVKLTWLGLTLSLRENVSVGIINSKIIIGYRNSVCYQWFPMRSTKWRISTRKCFMMSHLLVTKKQFKCWIFEQSLPISLFFTEPRNWGAHENLWRTNSKARNIRLIPDIMNFGVLGCTVPTTTLRSALPLQPRPNHPHH